MDLETFISAASIHKEGDGLLIITQCTNGYGDILRIAAYAEKIMKIYGKHVHIRYVVNPDTPQIHIDIDAALDNYNLKCTYEIEKVNPIKYKHNFTGLLYNHHADPVYNFLGVPKLETKQPPVEGNYVCSWHPYNNVHPVPSNKMPFDRDGYFQLMFDLPINIKFITYRDPINAVFETIRHAKLCVGYEGMGQQIAYHYNKQIVTFSRWRDVSVNTGGPDSFITSRIDHARKFIMEYLK